MPGPESAAAAPTGSSEWRAGWKFVALTALGLLCSPATLPVYTIGVLTAPLQASFGWGRGMIQTSILFSTGMAMIGAPLAAWMIERLGLRTTVAAGVTGLSAVVASCALMTGHIWQMYFLYGLMALFGAGAGAVSWTYLIATSFQTRRGLALGIALSGTGLAAMVLPYIAAAGLEVGGWRASYLLLALAGAAVILPLCGLFLPHTASAIARASIDDTVPGLSLGEAMRGRHFWLIAAATLFIYFSVGGLIPNIVPAMTDAGLSTAQAASIMGFFGAAIIVGRIGVGLLIDRFWAPAIAACVLIPAGLACLAFQLPLTFSAFAVAAMVVGVATGMEFDMLGYLSARYFGLAHFPRIYGRLYIFVALGAGTAPSAFGFAHDWQGNYSGPLILAAGLLIAGAVCFLALGKYPSIEKVPLPAEGDLKLP